jgi:uncharacterized protein (TIGR00661 family)
MKILFGVQSTGNGHICRSKEIILRLKALGHEIDVVLSGRKPAMLQELDTFGAYRLFRGLTFSTHRGRLKFWRTLFGLNLFKFYRDIHTIDASGYDLVVTDFEPISARVAKTNQIPSIGIGHQYAFLYNIPVAGKDPVSDWILKRFAPVNIPMGLHWHHFNQPILPPIIPNHIKKKCDPSPRKILVYLPFEETDDIIRLLKGLMDYHFYIYGKSNLPADIDNFHFRPSSRSGFLNDLLDCGGVISNAGFELPSEVAYLGKKLLVKPLQGQMEQVSNAIALEKLGIGEVMSRLDPEKVKQWIDGPSQAALQYPDVAAKIAKFIDEGYSGDIGAFARKVWSEIPVDIMRR